MPQRLGAGPSLPYHARAGIVYDNSQSMAACADAPYNECGWGEAQQRQPPTQGEALSMGDAREVMNIRQASQYLGVSPDTLYKYVSEELIPAFKLGNRWKFKKSLLDTWMEHQSLGSEFARPRKLTKATRAIVG